MQISCRISPSLILAFLAAAPFVLNISASGATILEFTPILPEGKSQETIYASGKPVGISHLDVSDIAVSCEVGNAQGKKLWINLTVQNKSSQPINVDPMTVTITAISNKKADKKLEVYEPDKFIARVKNIQAWSIALNGLSNSLNTPNAGATYSTTQFSGVAGRTNFTGIATTESYDYSKELAVRQAQQQQLMQQAMAYNQSSDALSAALLRRNTLQPGYTVGGAILCKYLKTEQYKISVKIGQEVHEMLFRLDKK